MNSYELFQPELVSGEKIMWTGQPHPKIFSRGDILFIPASLLWGGIASLFGSLFFLTFSPIFIVIGAFFVFAALYFVFGRFIYKIWKQKRTYYAVTDKRILIITRGWKKNVQTVFIDTVPAVNKSIGSSGRGSLRFGNTSFWASLSENTGLDFMATGYGTQAPQFYNIDDAQRVYDIIVELRQRLRKDSS